MHANPSGAGGGSPLRFLLPRSVLARRLITRGAVAWCAMRVSIGGIRAASGAPPGGIGWQGVVMIVVVVTAAVVIAERRRGVPPLLLANLGTPPAAGAAWVGGTVLALEAGIAWLP